MLDNPITPYGTDNPADLMEKFYVAGNEMLLRLRNDITNPGNRKKPRTWGGLEAANMIGISLPTLRKLTAQHSNIEGIEFGENKKKYYTLTAINHLRNIVGTRYKKPNDSKCLVIAVSNLKGGVGKTETAVDLGKKCAIEGLRALLIDFDAQGTATLISSGLIPDLELDYDDTITNILISNPEKIREVILKTHFDGFDIIPANLAIQDCDLILSDSEQNNEKELGNAYARLNMALENIKSDYDVIIIDCGPNIGILSLNAIISCNGMLVPIPPNMNDYSSFIMYTGSLRNLFTHLPQKKMDYFRIVLTKHNNSNEAVQVENMMRNQFGGYILANHMCETVEVAKAASDISTIYDITRPRGSKDAYRRAIQHLDDVNMEIINNFKDIWDRQAKNSLKIKTKVELTHENQ